MPKHDTDDLEISSDEENSNKENYREKNSDEENYSEEWSKHSHRVFLKGKFVCAGF